MAVNPTLFKLAQQHLWNTHAQTKQAVVAPPDPNAQAAPPGMPMDPAAMGGMPMDPAAMGGMPMDPAAMGGMPMDPAMMGGMPPAAPPAAPPAMPMDPMAAAMAPAAGTQKKKPEEYLQEINHRLHNLEQQNAAIMNVLQVQLPGDAMILPTGSGAPPAPPPGAAPADPAAATSDMAAPKMASKTPGKVDELVGTLADKASAVQSILRSRLNK